VSAQDSGQQPAPASLAAVGQRVPSGAIVVVSEQSGNVVKGALASASDDALELEVHGGRRRVVAHAIERVQWQQADSLLNGILIGAVIGAIPGIYWLIADPNECGGLCSEEYALIAGGALLGALVDRTIQRLVTVYSAGPASRSLHITISPSFSQDGGRVQLSLRF
jgi:hypothetical protein